MAAVINNANFELTSPNDNSLVTLSVPVSSGASGKIVGISVRHASPECSLVGVALSDTANTAATTLWKVAGKAGVKYPVSLCVSEDDGA